MQPPQDPRWIQWMTRLQAIAQNGLTFAHDPYDRERYQQLQAIAAEMLAAGSGERIEVIWDLLARDSGYATPKIDVRGVVFRDGRLLLVRERNDGLWTLPGGWADVGESVKENVVREIQEEAGFETRPGKLLAVFDRAKHPNEPPFPFHVYKMFIRCEIIGGQAGTGSETDEVDFFDENALPELSITRVTSGQIRRMFEHLGHPDWPTDFD